MRSKSLLHEMQSYLKTELELESPSPQRVREALLQKVESDRSRLLREVEIQSREETTESGAPFKRILVAVDASPQAMAAVDLAARLAGCGIDVKVALVHVVDDAVGMYEGFAAPVSIVGERSLAKEKGKILLTSAQERFSTRGRAMDDAPSPVVEHVVHEGPVVPRIIETAESFQADVIVIGTHARRGISHFLMGSTAEGVVRQAPCPVICVPGK